MLLRTSLQTVLVFPFRKVAIHNKEERKRFSSNAEFPSPEQRKKRRIQNEQTILDIRQANQGNKMSSTFDLFQPQVIAGRGLQHKKLREKIHREPYLSRKTTLMFLVLTLFVSSIYKFFPSI